MPRVEPQPLMLDIRLVLRLLRGYWYLLVLGLLLGGLSAYLYTAHQPKQYSADAVGLVTAGASQNAGDASVADTVAEDRADAFAVLGSSRAVAARAATHLGLEVSPAALTTQVSVEREPGSALLRVTATCGVPRQCSDLANAWVDALAAEVARIEGAGATAVTGQPTTGPQGLQQQGASQPGTRAFLDLVPIDEATVPSTPFSPDPRRNLELGLLGGLLVGLLLALLRYRLDRRIHGAEDLEPFPVPVSGVVPFDPAVQRDSGPSGLRHVTSSGNASATGEAIRKLRTNLQFMDVDHPPRTIVVTSPLSGDGKSTVAATLALALAASHVPVILVDADLRRPTQAASFGLVEGSGLTDLLAGRASFEDVVQSPPNHPGLVLVAAGHLPPNPSELLGSRRMEALLRRLSEGHTVIIDAPPLLPVTDASVLTANADGALVVVSARATLDTQLVEALGELAAVNGRVLGLVLNKVRRGARSGYYAYAYGTPATRRRRTAGRH